RIDGLIGHDLALRIHQRRHAAADSGDAVRIDDDSAAEAAYQAAEAAQYARGSRTFIGVCSREDQVGDDIAKPAVAPGRKAADIPQPCQRSTMPVIEHRRVTRGTCFEK